MENIEHYNIQKANELFSFFNKKRNELTAKYYVNHILTKEDLQDYSYDNLSEGQTIKIKPPVPNDPKEALTLLKNYYGAWQCELQKENFENDYKIWNEFSISTELNKIKDWIAEAANIEYKEAVEGIVGINKVILNKRSEPNEYLRLKNGFYEGHLMTWEQLNETSITAIVYGRYFLFRDFLEAELMKFQPKKGNVNLAEIFNKNNNAFEVCKELMDELDLTIDGKPNPDLKKGRAGTLIGMISAIIATPGMLSIDKPKGIELLKYFNSYLNTSYKTFDNRSKDYADSNPIALDFIKSALKK
jgi:hypothetical protein